MLKINTKAPQFSALDQSNKPRELSDFSGKYIILYFYPKDNTPGCTIEACNLRDKYTDLKKKAIIIGVSADSVDIHKMFAEKYHLPFILLADTNKEIINSYNASGIFTKRITYIIDPTSIIIKVYPNVSPSTHANEIVRDLENLT